MSTRLRRFCGAKRGGFSRKGRMVWSCKNHAAGRFLKPTPPLRWLTLLIIMLSDF